MLVLIVLFVTAPCSAEASVDQAVKAARDQSERALRAALTAKGLSEVVLERRHLLPQEAQTEYPLNAHEPWAAFSANGQTLVPSERAFAYCLGDLQHQPVRFVADGAKRVYRVIEKPHVSTRRMTSCGCQPWRVGGCGAPGKWQSQYGYVVPRGATYAGDKVIAFDAFAVSTVYAPTSPCAPPLSPP